MVCAHDLAAGLDFMASALEAALEDGID